MALFVANNGQLQTIKGIYYGMTEDYINATLFHNLVPKTATEIKFLYASDNPDLTGYQKLGYCDNNNFIEVWNNDTKYIIINPRKNYIYAPANCSSFLSGYNALTTCIFDNFDTRNTTNMTNMFQNCKGLTRLDLSSFNTQNVTNINQCFVHCESLVELNITFSCINLSNIYQAFYHCYNLSGTIDLGHCNTPNNISLQAVFGNCYLLEKIILPSNLNRSYSMYWAFKDCHRLTTIIANTIVSSSSEVFSNCTSLVGGNGTPYSPAHTNANYARIDGENGLPGYFTAPTN